MLHIQSLLKYRPQDYIWYLGDPFPCQEEKLNEIDFIQADGDELALILRSCDGIPKTSGVKQTWFGDMARFIIVNCIMVESKHYET